MIFSYISLIQLLDLINNEYFIKLFKKSSSKSMGINILSLSFENINYLLKQINPNNAYDIFYFISHDIYQEKYLSKISNDEKKHYLILLLHFTSTLEFNDNIRLDA